MTGSAGAVAMVFLTLILLAGFGARGESRADQARSLDKEALVNASLDEVWHDWTTSEGIASFFTEDCRIELALGGPYELYMGMTEPDESGKRGSEGCKVLSYIPKEMLSFEWRFPPKVMSLRKAGAKTHVVLRFQPEGEGVRVRFTQLGWREGEDWDAGYAYFDRAWTWVLDQEKQKYANRSSEERPAAAAPATESRTWTDGHVKVASFTAPERRQVFEMDLPLPREKVWQALATTEGLREFVSPEAEIELEPHGRYATRSGAASEVLSFVPGEMLSCSTSSRPRSPEAQEGATWCAYFLDAPEKEKTRLRLVVVGVGEEWRRDFDDLLKSSPAFLNALHERLVAL